MTAFMTLPPGEAIAYRHLPGALPAVVFLPGYMSPPLCPQPE